MCLSRRVYGGDRVSTGFMIHREKMTTGEATFAAEKEKARRTEISRRGGGG